MSYAHLPHLDQRLPAGKVDADVHLAAAFAEGRRDRQVVEIGIGVVRGLVAIAIDRLPKIALPI